VPHYHDGEIHYDGTVEVMAEYACMARDAGARVIGGCCGTTAAHIRAMAAALVARPSGSPPQRAAIEAALGPLPAPPASGAAAGRERWRRRRA
jgi:5-methyltetrahydrofolate--homocysteine methyltransferase